MTLSDYFEKAKGKGIIATADAKGKVEWQFMPGLIL